MNYSVLVIAGCLLLFYIGLRAPKAAFVCLLLNLPLLFCSFGMSYLALTEAAQSEVTGKVIPKCGNDADCLKAFAEDLSSGRAAKTRQAYLSLGASALALATSVLLYRRGKFGRFIAKKVADLENAPDLHASMDDIRHRMVYREEDASAETKSMEAEEAPGTLENTDNSNGTPKPSRRPCPRV